MALDVSSFYNQADSSGKAQKQEYWDYMDKLLTNQQQLDTETLNTQYNHLLDTLNTQLGTDLRENYLSSVIANDQLTQSLERSGVNNSGYGLTQQTLSNNNFSNIRGDLLNTHATNVKDSEVSRNTSLMQLMSDYMTKRGDAYDKSWMRYDSGFSQKYGDLETQLGQQNWQNEFDEGQRQFNESQKLAYAQLAASASARSGSSSNDKKVFGWAAGDVAMSKGSNGNYVYTNSDGAKTTVKAGTNPFTNSVASGVKFNKDGSLDTSSVFSNGYQPKTINGKSVKDSGQVITIDNGPGGSQQQKLWTIGDGKLYYWNGLQNKYVQYK